MSLETWKKEFYPIEAKDAIESELEAAKHSLLKWSGLRESSMSQHAVSKSQTRIYNIKDEEDKVLEISSFTCALCQRHLRSEGDADCAKCILTAVRGVPCDRRGADGNNHAPYGAWLHGDNPEPMIELLTEATHMLEQNVKA